MIADKLIYEWYVLHTKSNFEKKANTKLESKNLEVFLPMIKVQSRRKDRKLMIDKPVFPGYLFVKTNFDHKQHLEILKTPGIVRFIGNKEGAISVPDKTIESLQIMVNNSDSIETGTRFKEGESVVVIDGPLVGVTGIFVRYKNADRIIVNVDALGQHASVEVDKEDVEIIPDIMS